MQPTQMKYKTIHIDLEVSQAAIIQILFVRSLFVYSYMFFLFQHKNYRGLNIMFLAERSKEVLATI